MYVVRRLTKAFDCATNLTTLQMLELPVSLLQIGFVYPRLARQRANLDRFLQQENLSFDLLRYEPWVGPDPTPSRLHAAPSALVPHTAGVFSSGAIPPYSRIASYRGLLMSVEMHDLFNRSYHCPTAVRVPVLDYPVDASMAERMKLDPSEACTTDRSTGEETWTVRMVLVGDPCTFGPMINSPRGLSRPPNCKLTSCRYGQLSSVLSYPSGPNGKIRVSADVLAVWRTKCRMVDGDELLMHYDDDDEVESRFSQAGRKHEAFWARLAVSDEYCDICFSKHHTDASNPLVTCSHKQGPGEQPCRVGRHQQCFSAPLFRAADWYCPAHSDGVPLPSLLAPHAITAALLTATPPPAARVPPRGRPRSSLSPGSITAAAFTATPPSTSSTPVRPCSAPDSSAPRRGLLPDLDSSTRPSRQPSMAVIEEEDDPDMNIHSESEFVDSDKENTVITDSFGSVSSLSVCRRAQSMTRRTQPKRSLSLSSRSTSQQATLAQLSEAGRAEIRKVWKEFEPRIRKCDSRSHWHISESDYGSAKEQKYNNQLLSQWSQMKSCCFTPAELRAYPSNIAARFDELLQSPAGLLRQRLEYSERIAKFNRAQWKATITELVEGSQEQKIQWNGVELCDNCYISLVGVSRATAYRWLGRDDSLPSLKVAENGSTPKVAQLGMVLLEMSTEVGQSNPTADGTRGNKIVRVLPFTTQAACIQALEKKLALRQGSAVTVNRSTFQRAIRWLEENHNVILNMKLVKGLARCAKCETLQNEYAAARESRNIAAMAVKQKNFEEHLQEAREQRELFEEKKRLALRQPWELNVCTLDGMDCNKTFLPHYQRPTKDPRVEHKLNMRVVGAFYFGGPYPCIGITSFDDVPSKGGSAAVTNLEKIIDMQYERMDPTNIADIPHSEADAPSAPAQDPSNNALGSDSQSSPPECRRRGVDRSDKKVPFMWPRGLHVTFDNTAGDCKNSHVFRFLGLLVAIGVFLYVTVSTLLVGHTHDIVDQMFSCWARSLQDADAHTLSALHKLFREKYATGIYALESYIKEIKSSKDGANKRSQQAQVAKRLQELADELGVDPEIVHQTFCVDADSWCYKTINNLSAPHVFFIRKETIVPEGSTETQEAVVMYNRFLAQSYKDTSVQHNPKYADVEFGPWTTRKIILTMDEVPDHDPLRLPPQFVDTTRVQECVNCHFYDEKNMTQEEKSEMDELLRSFRENFSHAAAECQTCGELMRELHGIGTISQKSGATPDQEAFARNQRSRKQGIKARLKEHMNDPDAQHQSLRLDGWWTKWKDRVDNVIRPYYESRNLIAALTPEQQAETGRSIHPPDLVRDKDEAPIQRVRVDQEHLRRQGPPRVGDIVVSRGTSAMQPFFIGRVKEILNDADADPAAAPARGKRSRRSTSTGRHSKVSKSGRGQDAASAAREDATADAFILEWYNYRETAATRELQLDDEEHWRREMEAVGELQRWEEAHQLLQEGKFCRVPKASVDRLRGIRYARDLNWEDSTVRLEQMVVWGANVLTKAGAVSEFAWRRIVEDLCEIQDLRHNMEIDYAEEYKQDEPSAAAAASSAPRSRPRRE
jgi:hypothetical protein